MRFVKFMAVVFIVCCVFWCGGIFADRKELEEHIVCLQIIHDSKEDAEENTSFELKSAVASCLLNGIKETGEWDVSATPSAAIYKSVNDKLIEFGVSSKADVSISEEVIEAGQFDSVFLPTGRYQTIHIEIGDGKGKLYKFAIVPWDFKKSGEAYIGKHLRETICFDEKRQVRFLFLECFGRIEKIVLGES